MKQPLHPSQQATVSKPPEVSQLDKSILSQLGNLYQVEFDGGNYGKVNQERGERSPRQI